MLPRFLDATDQAHESTMKGIHGAFGSAVGSARAQRLAEGGNGNGVDFDGVTLPVSPAGWPTPVAGSTDCGALWNGLLQNPPPAIPAGGPLTAGEGISAVTLSNPAIIRCRYTYRPSYPAKPMWFEYYAKHPRPELNGRTVTPGF